MQNDPATDPEAEIRGDIELLKKVLAKWLVGHCPTSKALVGQYCSRKCVALMMAYSSKTTRQRAASVCVVLESLSGAVIGCADDMFRPTCCINDVQDWARSLDAAKGVTATLFVLGTDTPLDGGTELGFLATQQLQQQQQQQEQEQLQQQRQRQRASPPFSSSSLSFSSGSSGLDANQLRLTLIAVFPQARWNVACSNDELVFDQDKSGVPSVTRVNFGYGLNHCALAEQHVTAAGQGFGVFLQEWCRTPTSFAIGILSAECSFISTMAVGCARGSMGLFVHNLATWCTRPQACLRVDGRTAPRPLIKVFSTGDHLKMVVNERRLQQQQQQPQQQQQQQQHQAEVPASLMLDFFVNRQLLFSAPVPAHFTFPFRFVCTPPRLGVLVLERV